MTKYTWHPTLLPLCFSNSASSISTAPLMEEQSDKLEPVSSETRRRRPLRISSVSSMNFARLHHSRGSEYERAWNENLQKFRQFVWRQSKTQKGQQPRRLIKPTDYPRDKKLRKWVFRLRTEYRKKLRGQPNRLTEKRMEQLRKLGFQFIETTHRDTWDSLFQQLCTYLKEHDGHYPHERELSTLSAEDEKLYKWCNRQRVLYKPYMRQDYNKTYISEKRIQKLNSINFVWSLLSSQWDEKYEELKQYYQAHGNTLVPARYVGNYSLSRWVETQRRQYSLRNKNKPSTLTDERIQLLNELEFVWDPYQVRWMERYNELVEFQRLNGQFAMPSRANEPSLRRWLYLQGKQYRQMMDGKPSKMTAERKELLDQVGMDWNATAGRNFRGVET